MGGRRAAQRLDVIAALQQGDYSPLACFVGDAQQFGGDPGEIGLVQAQLGQRVGGMGIEPRRNYD
jgi:hypothetical protein